MKKDVVLTTIIGKDTEVFGGISNVGSARIDGVINGDVEIKGSLILGVTSVVKGNVCAESVTVGGVITGDIVAPEKIVMTSTARVVGNVSTSVIAIDEKAVFQGACSMNVEEAKRNFKVKRRDVSAQKKSAKAALAEALKEVSAEATDSAE